MDQEYLLSKISESSSLTQVQDYVKAVMELYGFDTQPIQDTMLLLLEETGELAKAIRKSATNMSIDVDKLQNYDTVESELADVFFVLLAVCGQMNVNLFDAFKEKSKENCNRTWSFER